MAMKQKTLEDFKVDLPLLIEAGFVAVKQLDETSAKRLFQAAQVISPDSSAPLIGLGYIELNKLNIKEAMQIFQGVIDKEPENYLAMTFLGISYLLTKKQREVGEKLINQAIGKAQDPTIVNLGKIALEWAEKDLKQLKSPFIK